MDKTVKQELLRDGVKPEHIGNGVATVNDLEAAGIGPGGVTDATRDVIDAEIEDQGADGIGDDSGADYSATDLVNT